jgi:predicted transglutaminase-like cysteine proteinase
MRHFFHVRLQSYRRCCWSSVWCLSLGLGLIIAAAIAAPDLDKTQALALQRYGTRAAETINAWRQLIAEVRPLSETDKLNKINAFFNRRIVFQSDLEVWGQNDYWASPLEFIGRGAGDCEDFAIAKYMTLQLLGIGKERLRLIYVRAQSGSMPSIAHMVLGFYPQPTEEPLILDNLISSVRPASQREDLTPVFSFNSEGLWVGGASTSAADPTVRLSRWRDVLDRMRQEGL